MIDNIDTAIAAFRERRKETINPQFTQGRLAEIDEAIRNSQPLLSLNDLSIKTAITTMNTVSPTEIVLVLIENKRKNRGIYLDKDGVFACVGIDPLSSVDLETSLEKGRKYYGFMCYEVMDGFMFLRPKYNKPEEVKTVVDDTVKLVERMLNGEEKLPDKSNTVAAPEPKKIEKKLGVKVNIR
jgi:hypothetical protein